MHLFARPQVMRHRTLTLCRSNSLRTSLVWISELATSTKQSLKRLLLQLTTHCIILYKHVTHVNVSYCVHSASTTSEWNSARPCWHLLSAVTMKQFKDVPSPTRGRDSTAGAVSGDSVVASDSGGCTSGQNTAAWSATRPAVVACSVTTTDCCWATRVTPQQTPLCRTSSTSVTTSLAAVNNVHAVSACGSPTSQRDVILSVTAAANVEARCGISRPLEPEQQHQ